MEFLLPAIPAMTALLFILLRGKRLLHTISIISSILLAVVGCFITKDIISLGIIESSVLGGLFYIDSLSIITLDVVIVIALITSIYTIGYLEEELKHGKITLERLKVYYILMYTFIFTIVLALTAKNMGIMWIAIEATTLASAFLVGFYNDKHSIEAAWKYVIICSIGIAIALLGIILMHLSSAGVIESSHLLEWKTLYNNAQALNSPTLRLAFIFILIGFGTKAGLAPLHTWLPDAHSQAPSPISALLSGVLLNTAIYGIIRAVAIVNKNLGSNTFTGGLLIGFGLLSILTAALFILTQKDYKRMLAYSSIEHMGIITLAIGFFTPLSVFGGLLHMINHSFTKSMLFLSSGNILQKYNTKEISKIKGLLKVLPVTGVVFLLGLFAIAGTPPFSVFASEYSIIASIFEKSSFILGAVFILLLAIVFAGIALTMFRIFYGSNASKDVTPGETNKAGVAAILVLLVIIMVSGLYLPTQIKDLIENAQKIIIGG